MNQKSAIVSSMLGSFVVGIISAFPASGHDPKRPGGVQPALETVCQAAGYVTVPMHRGKETDWWYIEATFDGKPMRLMVDTGAAVSALRPAVAKRLGYALPDKSITHKSVQHAPNVKYYQTIWPSLKCRELVVPTAQFYLLEIEQIDAVVAKDGDRPCDGLLGASFLHAYSAVLDYPAGKLYLLDPLKKEKELQGTWTCVRFEDATAVRTGEALRAMQLIIRDGTVTLRGQSGDAEYRMRLDPSMSPKRMDWISDEEARPLIYRIDSRQLIIAGPLQAAKRPVTEQTQVVSWRSAAPSEFRANRDTGTAVMTFEKDR